MNEPIGSAVASDPPATFGVRALARLADVTILNLAQILLLCLWAVLGAAGLSALRLIPWMGAAYALFCVGYFTVGTSGGRQTLGHRLAGLQVVREGEGAALPGLARSLGRSVLDLFFLVLTGYGIGFLDYLPIAVTPTKRALHDLAAGTRVVQAARPRSGGLAVCAAGVAVVPLVGVFLILRPFFMQAFTMPTPSMTPTISKNDHFLVNKLAYRWSGPRRGDIVLFDVPAEAASYFPGGGGVQFVKRVVGLPGDDLRMAGGHVFVYGQPGPLSEPYVSRGYARDLPQPDGDEQDDWFERRRASLVRHGRDWWVRVPPGRYFVLGDNRNDSNDSHVWGFLPRRNIVGKATLLFSPRPKDL